MQVYLQELNNKLYSALSMGLLVDLENISKEMLNKSVTHKIYITSRMHGFLNIVTAF